ncbi:hypothetical protein J8273_7812 [Carpediemonas membranifera]|uniref:Uncharacterized protein n=1 Tax=Carpediemonas membranifera TaxID=201153 RepID=A0A8J6DZI9_9EUKA|nr:hypothetical protein J8273_7812 [Carpediemonas membranifera]|eukprot:KAG9390461.1 hypothetical protein J8273_7812 [Carpediemonas membranifera]
MNMDSMPIDSRESGIALNGKSMDDRTFIVGNSGLDISLAHFRALLDDAGMTGCALVTGFNAKGDPVALFKTLDELDGMMADELYDMAASPYAFSAADLDLSNAVPVPAGMSTESAIATLLAEKRLQSSQALPPPRSDASPALDPFTVTKMTLVVPEPVGRKRKQGHGQLKMTSYFPAGESTETA